MSEPAPLDYERIRRRRPRRSINIPWVLLVPGVVALLFIMSCLLPGRRLYSQEARNREHCANNLHQIFVASMDYASGNGQRYPSGFGLLVGNQLVVAEALLCPSASDTELEATPAQQAVGLLSGGHCSYVYVGAGMTMLAGVNDVIAFDLPENHSKDGGNVLWGDGHVTWERFETLVQFVPELEAGRNVPVIGALTSGQAKKIYEQKWVPKLVSIKDGTWAASLPRPTPRPSVEAK